MVVDQVGVGVVQEVVEVVREAAEAADALEEEVPAESGDALIVYLFAAKRK